MTTQNAPGQDIVNPVIRALYNRALEEQSSELYYQELGLTDYEPDVPSEQLQGVTGPGKGQQTIEGQQFFSNTKQREYPTTLVLRKYTSELSWTDEDLHWLEKASSSSKRVIDFKNMPSQAVQALNQNINEDACKVFYLGFGTTFLTIGNSEALYQTHTMRVGATQSNVITSNAVVNPPLASQAVSDGILQMNRFRGQNNIQDLKCRNIKLIVTVEKEPTAIQLKWSDYGPQNNSLGLQVTGPSVLGKQGISLDVVVARDIPTSFKNYWFLVETNRAVRRAFMGWAWKPKLNEHPDFRKGIWFNDSSTFFGPVVQGWQWTSASTGASS